MIYGIGEPRQTGAVWVTKDVGLAVEWDCEHFVGGVFKREYEDGGRRYTIKKLADVFSQQDADELEDLINHIIATAMEQNKIRDNY